MRRNFKNETGFTLVELMMVLLIIAVTTKIVTVSFVDIGYSARYEQTKERLESIRQAILGNPKQIINGQQAVSGFVADMGRLPVNLRELVDNSNPYSDCDLNSTNDADGDGDATHDLCPSWIIDPTYNSGLGSGWRGPDLTVSNNPANPDAFTDGWGRERKGYCRKVDYTDQASCEASGFIWTTTGDDYNYGWYFNSWSFPYPDAQLIIQSYGKDHLFSGTDYDADYPVPTSQPIVSNTDWLVNISGGVSVNFIKSTRAIPNISFCTDATKITKATCLPPETWYGGCDKATYFNKTSCTNAAGTWVSCSDGTSATKPDCELVGKNWYGEGFGCSDQSKFTKAQCSNPDVWRSCTDDGTITTINACSTANEIWYGDNLFSISTIPAQPIPPTIPICMKVFYRKPDSSIGVLVSDENKATVINDPKLITADGSFQTIRFTDLRDSSSNLLVTDIPIGSNAIGVYQYDGIGCNTSNMLYPINHRTPIQVDFHPHTNLPVINW